MEVKINKLTNIDAITNNNNNSNGRSVAPSGR